MNRSLKERFLTEASIDEVRDFVDNKFPQFDNKAKSVMYKMCMEIGIGDYDNPLIAFIEKILKKTELKADDLAAINNLYADRVLGKSDFLRQDSKNKIIWNATLYGKPYKDIEFIVEEYISFDKSFKDNVEKYIEENNLSLTYEKVKEDIFFNRHVVKNIDSIKEGLANLKEKTDSWVDKNNRNELVLNTKSLKKALEDSGIKFNDSQFDNALKRYNKNEL